MISIELLGTLLVLFGGGGYLLYKLITEDSSGAIGKGILFSVILAVYFFVFGVIAESAGSAAGYITTWLICLAGCGAAAFYLLYYIPKQKDKELAEMSRKRAERIAYVVERNKREFAQTEAKLASGITKHELMQYMMDWQVVAKVTKENAVSFLELCKEYRIQRHDNWINPAFDARDYLGSRKGGIFYFTMYAFPGPHCISYAPTLEEVWYEHYKTCNVCEYEYVLHPEKMPDIALPGAGIDLDDM